MCDQEWKFLGELRLTDTPGHPGGTPPKVVDEDDRDLGWEEDGSGFESLPREPIHGDDLPRPSDEPDLPMAGDRW